MELDVALDIKIDDSVLIGRINGRLIYPAIKKTYLAAQTIKGSDDIMSKLLIR